MGTVTAMRPFRAALVGVSLVALLAGCEAGQMGRSGSVGDFAVVNASSERAVLSAQGQQVAVEPVSGFCVAEESIETSDRSAFVLIGDCALASGGMDLSAGLPGITTISISGDPGFGSRGASAGDLSALERYLATPEGRALLGRGGNGSEVSIIETRREENTLFVLVEDQAEQAVPLLATRFWRGFVELNGRLTVVTVSGFHDAPMDEDQMLRHLGAQVKQLQLANAAPIDEAPIQIARAEPKEAAQTVPSRTAEREPARAAGTAKAPPIRPERGVAGDENTAPAVAGSGQEEPGRVAWGSIPDWPPNDADAADVREAGDKPAELAALPSSATSRAMPMPEPTRSEPVIESGDRPSEPEGSAALPSSNQPQPISRPQKNETGAADAGERTDAPSTPRPAPRLSDSAREVVGSALAGSSAPLPPRRAQR